MDPRLKTGPTNLSSERAQAPVADQGRSAQAMLSKLLSPRVARWLIVGVGFAAFGVGLLKLLAGILAWPYWIATLCQGEITTILRFFLVDRWVFGFRQPTWKRLWQYHIANGFGFVIWWSTANILQKGGVHYILAAILAMGVSVGFSMLSNFLWIWRKPATHPH